MPFECHKGACGNCDPDMTGPDTAEDYGPTRECPLFEPAPVEKLWALRKAIAIDFDGCLCTDAYPEIGSPNLAVIARAQEERQRHGAGLILWTCREGQLLQDALDACSRWGLTFDAVNESLPEWIEIFGTTPRKVGASEYWDDKAVQMPAPINPPLTLEQIREMDGEPLWVVPLEKAPDWNPCWVICMEDYILVHSTTSESRVYFLRRNKDYGKAWLAYRQKPEV